MKKFSGWVSAPQEGAGGMRGGDLVFGGRDNKKRHVVVLELHALVLVVIF